MDSSTRRKLDDFRRALSEAISDSNEAARRLYELRREGFDLYLLLDGSGRELPGRTLEDDLLGGESVRRDQALQRLPRALPVRAPRASGAAAGNGEAPQFRITSDDVSWLRSLGIDPTRKTRRRRNDPR
jgi:hypothetical protein